MFVNFEWKASVNMLDKEEDSVGDSLMKVENLKAEKAS